MRKLFALFFAAAMLAVTAVSFASTPATEQGAADIKKQVEKALTYPMQIAIVEGPGLTLSGSVEVTPHGDYYEVKLPGAAFSAGIGFKINIGTIVANVKPNDNGSMTVSLSVPASMTAFDSSEAPVAEIKIGDQKFSGIWWPALAAFTEMNSEYKNVSLKSVNGDEFNGTADTLTSYVKLAKNADDTWSGPYGFGGKGVKLGFSKGVSIDVGIDAFVADSSYDKMNLAARKRIQDNLNETIEKASQTGEPTPGQANAMMQSMMSNLNGYLGGIGNLVKLTNITIDAKDDQTTATPGQTMDSLHATIANASTQFDVSGLLNDKGSSKIKLNISSLNVEVDDPELKKVLPSDVNLEVYLEDLPMQQLGKSLSEAFSSFMSIFSGMTSFQPDMTQQIEIQQQAMIQFMGLAATLPEQLRSAGTQLSIRNTYTKSPDLDSSLSGQFKANPTSPIIAEGSIVLSLKGIDELILKLQSLAQKPDASPTLARYASALSMLQIYGQPQAAKDGVSIRKLQIDLAGDGKILLNGQPLMGGAPTP